MYLSRCVDKVARHLLAHRLCLVRERKLRWALVTWLWLKDCEVYGASIEACWRSRFHSTSLNTLIYKAFGHSIRCGIARATSVGIVAPAVHQSREESSSGEHYRLGLELYAHLRFNALCERFLALVVEEYLRRRILPNKEVFAVFETVSPLCREGGLVALRSRTPHSCTLRAVEHTELDGREVGHNARFATECVNLAHDLSLGYATYGRVARHRGELGHIHRHQERATTSASSCRGGLASSVSCTNDYYIVLLNHPFYPFIISSNRARYLSSFLCICFSAQGVLSF